MLIYEQFVFIHMPKTAGTFITKALSRELPPPAATLGTHLGWDAIPPEAAGRPALMYVRNPWDWYVSWYHFLARWMQKQPREVISQYPAIPLIFGEGIELTAAGLRGVDDFPTVVRNACDNIAGRLEDVMADNGLPPLGLPSPSDDLYTARFKQMAGAGLGSDLLTIGRYESLLEDLGRFFRRARISADEDLIRRIEAHSPVNTGDRHPYRDYYDDELRDLVGQSCRVLVDRFGYSF